MSRKTENVENLTDFQIRKLKAPPDKRLVKWDKHTRNLALVVQPAGSRTWYFVYSIQGKPRWYRLGTADAVTIIEARKRVRQLAGRVADGQDPHAERRAKLISNTFEDFHHRYVEERAKKKNKSWGFSAKLIKSYVLPKLGKIKAQAVTRAHVREMLGAIEGDALFNLVLAQTSAVFTWAEKNDVVAANPCRGIERRKKHHRTRVLNNEELPQVWKAFDDAGLIRSTALKVLLLTGQRPGEVAHMRLEHIKDGGWWKMPGLPVAELGWPGTKNSVDHQVWLTPEVRELIAHLHNALPTSGFAFAKVVTGLEAAMRKISNMLKLEPVRPHDLRRTHGTMMAALGFTNDDINRIENHVKKNSMSHVYNQHRYAEEDKRIMEAVARRIMALVEGGRDDTVVAFRK
jgi:integrase